VFNLDIWIRGTGSIGWECNQLTELGSISTQNYGMMGAIALERPAFQPICVVVKDLVDLPWRGKCCTIQA
jgi:hypothetical protein